MQAAAVTPNPRPISAPKPVQSDPLKFLDGFRGDYDTDLFTGSATYAFPLAIPPGRGKATPAVSLNYSSSGLNLQSLVGYGWSLPTNAIFRSTAYGTNNLYSRDDYAADIFGNYAQLIVTDTTNKVYAAKTEGAFVAYDFDPASNSWLAIDKEGTKYFFGTSAAARHSDPANAARVYKWMLDKVQDTNGNTITLTYFADSGQIYPDTIRYSGSGSDPGIYELRFPRAARSTPTLSYETGFGITTKFRITAIDLYSYASGSAVLARHYALAFTTPGPVDLLTSLTVSGSSTTMPPVSFQYMDNTETLPAGYPLQKKYLLKKITSPEGGTTALLYKPSTAYRTPGNALANSKLPFIVLTLSQLTVTDPVRNLTSVTTFEYEGGHYFYDPQNAFTREYAGFQKVTVTDPVGNVTKEYFHQSQFAQDNAQSALQGEFEGHISKKGRAYRTEQYDNAGKLFILSVRKWNKTQITDANPTEDAFFPYLERETTVTYDSQTTGRATAVTYAYDQYGNNIQAVDYGEVTLTGIAGDFTDTGSDKLTTTTEYAMNTGARLLAFPKRSETKDQAAAIVAEQKISYDGLAYGTAPTKGNPTKSETMKAAGQYVITQASYNTFGLPTSISNARNFTTTIAYDSFNLYPATVTNAKDQATAYTYNYQLGAQELTTDANGLKTQSTYDGLGRLTKKEISDPNSPAQFLTQVTYAYDLATAPVSVTATAFANNTDTGGSPIEVTAKTYFDGLGRPIQTRTEGEGSNKYLVAGTVYDNRGNVKKQLSPQFGTGLAFDTNFNESKPGTATVYDALNRVTAVTVPFGPDTATSTTGYDRWKATVTDARGYKKDFINDARGNLIQVKEYLTPGAGASLAGTTAYAYDINNHLTQITDAAGNIKTFAYDLLGRKTAEDDFHTSADTTYSHWTYDYDNNGNLTSVTDAKDQTTNFTYDELDQPLSEDFTGQAGTEIAYTYDTAPNGKGRIASITTKQNDQPVITKAFEYDLLGRTTKETRTIGAVSFVTNTEYDPAGNPKRIVYPDVAHTEALYAYNNAGQLEKVQKKEGATATDLVTNLDYAETGPLKTIAYANGVVTTQTYDITYNYFLTEKETTKGTTKIQDLSYAFDKTGNITGITDTSATNAAKIAVYTYDGLSRLTDATITNAANGQNYSQTFVYDILGNITNKSDVGAYSYAQTDFASPHAVTGAGDKIYAYDENGNMTGDATWTHAWDYKDRLFSSAKTGTAVAYSYDEGGIRVTKANATSGNTTTYVSDLLDIEAGTEKLAFYANGLKLATQENTSTPTLAFHHSDHLSSASVDTDAGGSIVQLTDYYPFGDTRIEEASGAFHNDYTYTGKERDEDTALLYYEARYYDSKLAKFTSRDSWSGDIKDPQSLNKYVYVRNNPLKYVDPDGRKVELYARGLNGLPYGAGVHTYLVITPDKPADFGVENPFHFTVGGYDKEGQLVGEINKSVDLNWPSDKLKEGAPVRIKTPEGKNDTQFIMSILKVYGRYNDGQPYDAFADDEEGYNCNEFTTSLVQEAGGKLPNLDFWGANPGLGVSIPVMMKSINNNSKDWRTEFQTKVLKPAMEYDRKVRNVREFYNRIKRLRGGQKKSS